jgi:Sigma54-dependent transcription regulator containing an AAA-type ATPase domain and a DNA-binding domain
MPSQDVLEKYNNVKLSLENAIATSDNIKISGEEENAELSYIRSTLNQLNDDFKAEIERLESSSEWDRFCMAFFGETNAGKSTIIEALRIVYDEESRREEINNQRERFNEDILEEKEEYAELISNIKNLNESLIIKEKSRNIDLIKYIGIVVLGIVIGFVLAFILL